MVGIQVFSACKSSQKLPFQKSSSITNDTLSYADQRKFDYYFLEAQRLKYLGKLDAAFDLFSKCSKIDTASASACYELADFYLNLNNAPLALDCIRKAARVDSNNFWYLTSYANLTQSLNLNKEAETVLHKLVAKYPDKPELQYSLVQLYTQTKELRKAISTLDKLELQVGLSEEISIEKFKMYYALKEPKKAFSEVQKLVEGFPKDVRYRILLGDLLMQNNQLKEAFVNYELVKSTDPDNGFLAVSLANYFEKTGDKIQADIQIRAALLNPKTEVETKHKILNSYLSTRLDKIEEAENITSLFNTLIEMHPQEESFYQLYADYLITQKKTNEAREKLVFAVGLAPTNVELWRQLLNVDLQLNDYAGVVEVCEQAISYFPDASEFYFYKGMGNYLKEDYRNAILSYQDGLKVVDLSNKALISNFYGQIGDVYQRLGKTPAAYQAYDSALVYNENNIVVLNNYAYYLSVDKVDLHKAEQMSGKCIAAEPNNSTYLDTYAWIYFVEKNYVLAKFYIEKALSSGGRTSEVIIEHYGDILVMSGEIEKGLEQWNLSLKMGSTSELLQKKIDTKTYIEEPLKR